MDENSYRNYEKVEDQNLTERVKKINNLIMDQQEFIFNVEKTKNKSIIGNMIRTKDIQ